MSAQWIKGRQLLTLLYCDGSWFVNTAFLCIFMLWTLKVMILLLFRPLTLIILLLFIIYVTKTVIIWRYSSAFPVWFFFGVLNMYLQWIYFCMYIIFYLFLLTLNVIISSPKCKLYVNGLFQNCIYFHWRHIVYYVMRDFFIWFQV